MVETEIIAIGLLTKGDLDRLGSAFDRAWPIEDAACFEELLRAIDEAEGGSFTPSAASNPEQG
ncbi:MAG TPA: hypothetical protein VNA29_04680 [Sphingomicrobium sp.]|nr:hypothetical protein [Sphingomicrobium sp.]